MSDLFISYAREDTAFVRCLYDALKERGREAWVDWEGIPPIDKWLDSICSSIERADAFLFVISPDSVESEVCKIEFDQALKQHKRLIPVMHREVGAQTIRPELSEINWIFARAEDSFDEACETILKALDTDLEWVKAHTRLLVRASEWDRAHRDSSYTLRGRDLNDFEEWLAKSLDKDPKPIALHSEYLLASRRAVTRRQRIIWISVAVGFSIAVGLGIIAYVQKQERDRQERIADARQLINKADALRNGSVDTVEAGEQLKASTQAATHALATLDALGVSSLDATQALRKSYAKLPKWMDFDLGHEQINATAFDHGGKYLAVFQGREHFMVWDTKRQQKTQSCNLPLSSSENVNGMAVNGNGELVATAVYNSNKEVDSTEVTLWLVSDCQRNFRVLIPGKIRHIALGGNGSILVVAHGGWKIRIWDINRRKELVPRVADFVLTFALSPIEQRLVTIEKNKGVRKYWIRIHDLKEDRVVQEWEHPERVEWVRFGVEALVVSDEQGTTIYNLKTEETVRHPFTVQDKYALSGDNRLVARPIKNYVIQIRDTNNAEIARSSHGGEIGSLAFTPDNHALITVDEVYRRIRAWFFNSTAAFADLRDEVSITRIQFSEDVSHLYTASDHSISAWKLPQLGDGVLPIRQGAPKTVALDSIHYQIRASSETDSSQAGDPIIIYDMKTGLDRQTMMFDARVLAASVNQNGERLAVLLATKSTRGGYARSLEMWDIVAKKRIDSRSFDPMLDESMASYLSFLGNDQFLAIGRKEGVEIVKAEDLTSVATLYHAHITMTAINSKGTIAATMGSDGMMRIWEIDGRKEVARIEIAPTVRMMALSNDHRWLATLDHGGMVQLWAIKPPDLIQQACRWVKESCP